MLTAKQNELLSFIRAHISETGISPSFDEMKLALNLVSKSSVYRLVNALEERGAIRRLHNRARAIEIVRRLGTVTCSHCGNVIEVVLPE